jgi:predicted transcriptional regulator
MESKIEVISSDHPCDDGDNKNNEEEQEVMVNQSDNSSSSAVTSTIFTNLSFNSQFSFQFIKKSIDCIDKSSEIREQLHQYNLTTKGEGVVSEIENLQFFQFRYHGHLNSDLLSDYETLLKDFFSSKEVQHVLSISGDLSLPIQLSYSQLSMTVLTMDFFDRFYQNTNIITADGRIKGCFDETFDGITVSALCSFSFFLTFIL